MHIDDGLSSVSRHISLPEEALAVILTG